MNIAEGLCYLRVHEKLNKLRGLCYLRSASKISPRQNIRSFLKNNEPIRATSGGISSKLTEHPLVLSFCPKVETHHYIFTLTVCFALNLR